MKLIQTVKRRMGSDKSNSAAASTDATAKKGQAEKPKAKATPSAKAQAEGNMFTELGKLREAAAADRTELFRKKLQICGAIVFNFHNDDHQKEKEAKRQTLLEIVEYVNNTRNCFNESLMADVVNMVGANIFRSLPARKNALTVFDPEEDEPALEPSWPHLQIVYEFFLRFIVSNDVDPKIAKRFVDQNFVLKLLDLFDSEDPRERDYLKTILHRTYGKFMALRSFIRRAIQHTFFKVIYESEMQNGIGELLEILGSIINGFALPLKQEHSEFLVKALIPLHKVKSLSLFYQQLSYCLAQYAEKDPRLCYDIIYSLLQFWPVTITSKQILFINLLEEMLEMTQQPEFHRLQELIFRRIALCITSPHFQVAERTLFLWNNDYIVKLIDQNRDVLFPIVIGALYTNSKQHWNSAVHGLTFNVLKLLMESDPQLFDECSAKHKTEAEEQEARDEKREQRWAALRLAHDETKKG